MEKQFNELLEKTRAEFPHYVVTMGLSYYEHQPIPQWWISLKGTNKVCGGCGKTLQINDIDSFGSETFDMAFTKLKELVAKKEIVSDAA